MARFHINPETGMPGSCSARAGNCPFAGVDEHYNSPEAARAAYEGSMSSASVPTASKKVMASGEPAPVYLEVEKESLGSELKKGQSVEIRGAMLPIRALRTGYKYATVTVPDLKKGEREVNIPLDEKVTALVKVETEESKEMRKRYNMEDTLARTASKYEPQRNKVVADMQDRINKGYLLDGFQISNLVEAEAKDAVMARYKHEIEFVKENEPDEAYPHTRAEERIKEEFQGEVIQSSARANNVSSSEGSNLYDRAMLSAKADFLRRGAYMSF